MGAPRSAGGWGQAFPNAVACLRAEERFVMAAGALNRNGPTGGWAKGTPSHFSTPGAAVVPRKVPEGRRISKFAAETMAANEKARAGSSRKYFNIVADERSSGFRKTPG